MQIRKFLLISFFFAILFGHNAEAEQIRLGIMPFVSRTNEIGESQATAITDLITGILHSSPSIAVIERERLRVIAMENGFNASNENSITKLGQLSGCQYILLGAVTQITQRYLSSTKFSWFLTSKYSDGEDESQEATAKLEARIIDVATGRVVLSFSQSGSAIVSDKQKYSRKDLINRAIEAASSRLCDEVRKILVNEYSMVIAINKNNIRINRGRASSVNPGSLYKVYQDGEEIFDLNGKSLGKRKINLALLRVVNVQNDFSDVEIVSHDDVKNQAFQKNSKKKAAKTSSKTKTNRSNKSKKSETENIEIAQPILIHEGDKIEAISFAEAEKLKLASQRIGEDK